MTDSFRHFIHIKRANASTASLCEAVKNRFSDLPKNGGKEDYMDKKGTIITQVYTSRAQLPVENATVTILKSGENEKEVLAHRVTDKSGKTSPVTFDTPALSLSQTPGNGIPFSIVDLKITHPEFYGVLVREVQVFPDTETIQNVELIPIEETNSRFDVTETVNITPQNL